jgi:hypothetical protein
VSGLLAFVPLGLAAALWYALHRVNRRRGWFRPGELICTSSSCEAMRPLRGEKEPSKTAEPMVKASAPASARARMRAGESMLPATTRVPSMAPRAARTRSSGSASVAR